MRDKLCPKKDISEISEELIRMVMTETLNRSSEVADAMGQSRENLHKKLSSETLRYKELKMLSKVLGKKMVWIDDK